VLRAARSITIIVSGSTNKHSVYYEQVAYGHIATFINHIKYKLHCKQLYARF